MPVEPEVSRPSMPEGYGVPSDAEGLLPWSWVEERLDAAATYWIGTTRPDGRPHAVPIWGAWLDDTFYFEGSPDTRRGRNLAHNPAVVVHLDRGDDVVIVEGTAEEIGRPARSLATRLAEAFARKYRAKHGYAPKPDTWDEGGLYAVRPSLVLAWSDFPRTTTRFRFPAGGSRSARRRG